MGCVMWYSGGVVLALPGLRVIRMDFMLYR